MALHAIILSGGHGSRLWPASRPERPKQFLPLLGKRSMFQTTVMRMAEISDSAPIVVAGEGHAAEIGRQLAALQRSDAVLLIEPAARDSGPAIAAAAAWIAREDPDGVAVMVASDHHLPDVAAFATAVATAVRAAKEGAIVTFGVRPVTPSEAYGYIMPGEVMLDGVRRVARFTEKPDAATARRYIMDGALWNSGNFVSRVATLLEAFDRHAPHVADAARGAVAQTGDGPGVHRLGPDFLLAPKVSFDYAVMEETDLAAVVALDAPWSDLGAWDAVHAAHTQDRDGNVAPDGTILHDTRGSLVRVETNQTVAVLGLTGVAVIVEDDAILVASLDASQHVKRVVDRLVPRVQAASAGATPPSGVVRLRRQAQALGRWLRLSALPLWCTLGVDRGADAFHETLDAEGRPPRTSRRLRVQARQTYVYALAGARGWNGPWAEAVALGLRSMREHHRLPSGGYATLVSPDGAIVDDAVMLYDHAFVLLSAAWAKRAGVWDEAEADALKLVDVVLEPRRNRAGGFRETDEAHPWQSNPHMHLFECFLAWSEIGVSPRWRILADEIAELALTRFIDPQTGADREFFKADWSPADGVDGRVVEPGHQFEWSWLLDRWGELAGRADARKAARRLYEIGATYGVDAKRGVAVNRLQDDFSVDDGGARLWPQTERLKAALRLADASNGAERDRLLMEAADGVDGLARYFEGVGPGLWRDKLKTDGTFVDEPSPASSLYHIVTALAELEDRTPKA